MVQPGLFSVYFRLFKPTFHFYNKNVKIVHPKCGTGIRSHELQNISLLPYPIGQGSRPITICSCHSIAASTLTLTIAQWIRPCLPLYIPGFASQVSNIWFYLVRFCAIFVVVLRKGQKYTFGRYLLIFKKKISLWQLKCQIWAYISEQEFDIKIYIKTWLFWQVTFLIQVGSCFYEIKWRTMK